MNVSKEADAEFLRLLKNEDSKRFENLTRNMRGDTPNSRMSDDQALTNFQLGLPTGQHRFAIVAGNGTPVSSLRVDADRLLHDGTTEEYVAALMAFVNEDEPISTPSTQTVASGRHKRSDAKFITPAQKQKAYRERKQVSARGL